MTDEVTTDETHDAAAVLQAEAPSEEPTVDEAGPKDDETLGEAGKAALQAERKARRDAEKRLRDLEASLRAKEDEGKPEAQRAEEARKRAEEERDTALLDLARHRALVKHGLTEDDLEFLVGSPDEIEERAARLAARLSPAAGKSPAKPKPDLSQGRGSASTDPNAAALGVLGF